jgi:membrane protease YdiL (CAAX protease family)
MIARAETAKLPLLWKSMVAVAIVAAVPRFYWMLTGSYNAVIIIFIVFALLPFIVLDKNARREIGFVRMRWHWATISFLTGVVAASLVYLAGYVLFGNSELNWFVAIMKTFDKDKMIQLVKSDVLLFMAVSLPVMVFSPLGEEFFFRGLLHESLTIRFSSTQALTVDAVFFGVTHLAHYGLLIKGGSLHVLPSAAVWIVLMSATAIIFYKVKRASGSIWGAVLCHSGFNLAMMTIIFYVIN